MVGFFDFVVKYDVVIECSNQEEFALGLLVPQICICMTERLDAGIWRVANS